MRDRQTGRCLDCGKPIRPQYRRCRDCAKPSNAQNISMGYGVPQARAKLPGECVHHWDVDGRDVGTCRKCGEVRQFEGALWK